MALIAQNKWIVAVVGALVAGAAWWGLSGGGGTVVEQTLTAEGEPVTQSEQTLVQVLLTLKTVKLDGTIFSDPTFTSLKDISTPIITEPMGRDNPFAPLGKTGAAAAGAAGPGAGAPPPNSAFTPR